MRHEHIDPNTLEPNQHHVRSVHDPPDERLVASVDNVGIVNVLIGTESGGKITLVDGVRRAKAAVELGMDAVPVLVRDLEPEEIISQSMFLNSSPGTAWNKTVVSADREETLDELAAMRDESRDVIERDLGLLSEADRIERALDAVPGVGEIAAERLANRWTLEELQEENVLLTSIDGIGEKTANAIHRHLTAD